MAKRRRNVIGELVPRPKDDGFVIESNHGHIEYRPVPKEGYNEIWWVESDKKGHGSELVDAMMKHHPAEAIHWGATSQAGEGLRKKWHRNNPHVADATGGERVPFEGQFDPYDSGRPDMDEDGEFFSTLDEIERHSLYRSAAVKHLPTGKIIEGTWHGEAMNNAMDQGLNTFRWDDFEDGFVTHGGEYHTRERASEEARAYAGGNVSGRVWAESDTFKTRGIMDTDRHFYESLDEIDRFNIFRSAAIKHKKTGEVYEGTWHEAARQAANEEGHDPWGQSNDWEDGFVNHDGEFLTRDQARVATNPDPEHRTGGQDESVEMMIAGNLPVDETLVNDPDVRPSLASRLNDHLRGEGRIDFDEWRANAGHWSTSRARRRDPFVEVSDLEDRLFNMPTEEGTK